MGRIFIMKYSWGQHQGMKEGKESRMRQREKLKYDAGPMTAVVDSMDMLWSWKGMLKNCPELGQRPRSFYPCIRPSLSEGALCLMGKRSQARALSAVRQLLKKMTAEGFAPSQLLGDKSFVAGRSSFCHIPLAWRFFPK